MEGSCFYETLMSSIGAYFTNECVVRITLQQLNRQRQFLWLLVMVCATHLRLSLSVVSQTQS